MSPVFYHVLSSPVGDLTLVSNGVALTGVYMSDQKGGPDLDSGWLRDEGEFDAVAKQLAAYFAGERREFDLPLAPHGTDFQKKIWRELCRIPYGETISYGELARRIGQPGASRAVGLANGRNPIGIIIPCHRVIGADGALTGYGGGLDRKKWLLEHEKMTGLGSVSRNLFAGGRRTVEKSTRAAR
jgi:methylated-DNA-[protein]-cysteine S-methyltransferase